MKKNVIKLNESQLKKIIAESVKKVLSEIKYTNSLGQTRDLHGNDPDSWDFAADERNFRRKAAMTTMNIADDLNDNDMFQDASTRYIKNRDNRWMDMANADELRNGKE